MTEYGEPIRVDGVRPEWLRDSDVKIWTANRFENHAAPDLDGYAWSEIEEIVLPSSHPFYTVQRYNAEHGTSFVYWPGGDNAPEGVEEGDDVLLRNGKIGGAYNWGNDNNARDIIGYTAKHITSDTVTLKRMSEAEWGAFNDRHQAWNGSIHWARAVGLIRTPTRAETIAAKSGVAVDVVERVLGVMGDE